MTRDDLRAALSRQNVAAFLRVIRAGESSRREDAYTIQYGGKHFAAPPWESYDIPWDKLIVRY